MLEKIEITTAIETCLACQLNDKMAHLIMDWKRRKKHQ